MNQGDHQFNLQEYLQYGDNRALDMSMTSVYSTPRNQNMHTRNFEGVDANDSQMDMYSN